MKSFVAKPAAVGFALVVVGAIVLMDQAIAPEEGRVDDPFADCPHLSRA
jgi:hypothetical protein